MKTSNKIMSLLEVLRHAGIQRAAGRKVAFTNGVFDILHEGHLDVLEEAKRHAQYVVVGINSDKSVTRMKGPSRPVLIQNRRAAVVAGLANVDAVVIFNEDTPLELIKVLSPDVLLKGGDWDFKDIVGNDIVPKVVQVKTRIAISDSLIIEAIQSTVKCAKCAERDK